MQGAQKHVIESRLLPPKGLCFARFDLSKQSQPINKWAFVQCGAPRDPNVRCAGVGRHLTVGKHFYGFLLRELFGGRLMSNCLTVSMYSRG
jgi:hypothetical protein